MSSVTVRVDGDVEELLAKMKLLSDIDKAAVMQAIAEGLRTSTEERFREERSPQGQKWKPSVRARREGGNTLTMTAALKNSISAKADASGAAVGTNVIYAATHQFGAERTIRAKKGKYLTFKVNGSFVRKESVSVKIPARPFLGVSDEDLEDIRDIVEEAVSGGKL